eukprot:1243147-Rhodomonas_salina.3
MLAFVTDQCYGRVSLNFRSTNETPPLEFASPMGTRVHVYTGMTLGWSRDSMESPRTPVGIPPV